MGFPKKTHARTGTDDRIEYSGERRFSSQVTFNKDVTPVLQSRYQACHHEGDIGPVLLIVGAQANGEER